VRYERTKTKPKTTMQIGYTEAYSIQHEPISDQLETIVLLPSEARVLCADSSGHNVAIYFWAPTVPRDTPKRPHRFYCISERTAFIPPANVKLIGTLGSYNRQFVFEEIGEDDEP
jgi:hypothetical protein